jgi:succinate dehydrogenase / fumarate reductase membrane anchor subunit
MSLSSPLKKARGLGSAREGVQHWWIQRLSALPLIPLGLWGVFSLAKLGGEGFPEWLSNPAHAWALAVLVVLGLYHGYLGMQVVIEDYVHHKIMKLMLILGMQMITGIAILSSLASLFDIVAGR